MYNSFKLLLNDLFGNNQGTFSMLKWIGHNESFDQVNEKWCFLFS